MLHRSARRSLIGFAAAAAAATIATPAFAAATPHLDVLVRDTTVAAGYTTTFSPNVYSAAPVTFTGASLTYQLTGALAGVNLTPTALGLDCSNLKHVTKLVCDLPNGVTVSQSGLTEVTDVTLGAVKAKAGETGGLAITFSADGIAPITESAKITVAKAVDLVAGPDQTASVAPGGKFDANLSVTDSSPTAAKGVALLFDTDYAFETTKQYSNCYYLNGKPTACLFDQKLTSGTTYQVSLPYQLRADTAAPSSPSGNFEWMTPGDLENLLTSASQSGGDDLGTLGKGKKLALTPQPAVRVQAKQIDPDPNNNWQQVAVTTTGQQGTDFAAIGGTVTGQTGDIVETTIGVHNNGPATLDQSRLGDSAVVAVVTPPAGTTVTTIPAGCEQDTYQYLQTQPGVAQYLCFSAPLFPADTTVSWTFGLKITGATAGAAGSIAVNPACECEVFDRDTNKANDVAPITLAVTGSGAGTPSTGASSPSTGSSSAPATATASASSSSSGGTLPLTGPQAGLVGGVGAVIIAAGAAGFVATRRRRTRFEA